MQISARQWKVHPPIFSGSFTSTKHQEREPPILPKLTMIFFSPFFPHTHNVGSKGIGYVTALTSEHWQWFSIYHGTGNYHLLQSRFQNTTWYPWLSAAAWHSSQGYRFAPIWTTWQSTAKLFCRHTHNLWPKLVRPQAGSVGHKRSQMRSMGSVNCNQPTGPASGKKSQSLSTYFRGFQAPAFRYK